MNLGTGIESFQEIVHWDQVTGKQQWHAPLIWTFVLLCFVVSFSLYLFFDGGHTEHWTRDLCTELNPQLSFILFWDRVSPSHWVALAGLWTCSLLLPPHPRVLGFKHATPSLGLHSLWQCTVIDFIGHLSWMINDLVNKVALKSLFFHIGVSFWASLCAGLKNHMMKHLKFKIHSFINTRKPEGLAESPFLTLNSLAYIF